MKILIVDDSKAMRGLIKRTLRQAGWENIETLEAGSGSEALQLIPANSPDLMFLDWNMPGMSGLELAAQVKQNGWPVKYVFVTSEGTPEMIQKALDAGALVLIAKPFAVEDFQNLLDKVA